MIEIKMTFDRLEDAENHLSAVSKMQEAEAAVHEFYYMLRNKTKHGEHSEAETQTLENIRADFYRLFKNFFPE
jgi:hypothetical protein